MSLRGMAVLTLRRQLNFLSTQPGFPSLKSAGQFIVKLRDGSDGLRSLVPRGDNTGEVLYFFRQPSPSQSRRLVQNLVMDSLSGVVLGLRFPLPEALRRRF